MIIDLSVHNGTVDFSKITNVEEIFIRSSLGYGYNDKNLGINARAAVANGFPVSYYHFAYPHDGADPVLDAQKQANWFVDTINTLPKFTHLAVDLENFSATADTHLSKGDYAKWLQSFLDTVEKRTGAKCVIYTYVDYLNRHLPEGHAFGSYPLWIANYGNTQNPALPKGWDKYFAWQYSEAGAIAGVAGHVDLSKTS